MIKVLSQFLILSVFLSETMYSSNIVNFDDECSTGLLRQRKLDQANVIKNTNKVVVEPSVNSEDTAEFELSLAMENFRAYRYEKALSLFKESARSGNNIARFNLGIMFEFGRGTSIDYQEAAGWYTQAIANGYNHPDVFRNLTRVISNMNKTLSY